MNNLKNREFNVMANIKIIESLKAQLICVIGNFYNLLTKGSNVAHNAIIDSISGAIIILYVLAEKLGYNYVEVDRTMNEKLKQGIKAQDEVEKNGKSLTKLKEYINNRI